MLVFCGLAALRWGFMQGFELWLTSVNELAGS